MGINGSWWGTLTNRIKVKVCGLTSLEDARCAVALGADSLGFIFHPASPRFLSAEKYEAIKAELPTVKKVAVVVEPDLAELERLLRSGFEHCQLHFRSELPLARVQAWATCAGRERLWLAPRLPPGADIDPEWLPLAGTILLDTYHAEKFGGTGRTGDWSGFRRLQSMWVLHKWVLSGGLTPDNVGAAVAATKAEFIDVNSGVESAPGRKDHGKLRAFFAALRG